MKHELIKPPECLQKFVRYFSVLEYDNDSKTPNQIKVFADRYPHLVFQHCNGHSAFSVNGQPLPTTFLSGIKIAPYTCDVHYKHTAITITFYPQAIKHLFGMEVHELNDELVDIHHFSLPRLNEELLNANSTTQVISILIHFLTKRIQHFRNENLLIESILTEVNKTASEQSLPQLLRNFNISERKLERLFKASMGFTPKFYLRATRFEKALSIIRHNGYQNLSDIAFALNFTDQSHFIKDFKEFSGLTPKAYLNKNTALDFAKPSLKISNSIITINHEITY